MGGEERAWEGIDGGDEEVKGGNVTPVEELGEEGDNSKADKIAIHIGPNIS